MNDLENRLRSGLRARLGALDAEGLLEEVARGVTRRRRRRAAVAVVATVLVVAGAVGTVVALSGDGSGSADPSPLPPVVTPTQPVLPEGAAQGVIDVAAPSSDQVFRLTINVGCVGCSTVWLQDPSVEGGWERLNDFGAEAYSGRPDPSFGPLVHLAMATDGENGWAWGSKLYATHDGGRTWLAVTTGPGRRNNEYGHQVVVTDQAAWSLLRTDRGTELWRSPLGSDVWTRDDAPDMGGVSISGLVAIGRHVALETSDEGLSNPRLQYSPDGTTWGTVADPCPGDQPVQAAITTAFLACPAGRSPTIQVLTGTEHRVLDLDRWERFGTSPAPDSASVIPLGDLSVLVVAIDGRAWVMGPDGTRQVDLGLKRDEEVFRPSAIGTQVLLLTSSLRLLSSGDGGLTWHPVD